MGDVLTLREIMDRKNNKARISWCQPDPCRGRRTDAVSLSPLAVDLIAANPDDIALREAIQACLWGENDPVVTVFGDHKLHGGFLSAVEQYVGSWPDSLWWREFKEQGYGDCSDQLTPARKHTGWRQDVLRFTHANHTGRHGLELERLHQFSDATVYAYRAWWEPQNEAEVQRDIGALDRYLRTGFEDIGATVTFRFTHVASWEADLTVWKD